jgi:hypothetical protein
MRPDLQDDVEVALKKLAHGPIQGFIDPECCKVLEDLSKESKIALFEAKDAETSIHIKRAPLVPGSDVNVPKKVRRSSKKTPQDTEEWMAAATKLLAAQRQLLYDKFGSAFVILDRFDFGPQVLFALAQRQRTHGDGLSFFISGLLQFNVLMLLCYKLYKLLFYYL